MFTMILVTTGVLALHNPWHFWSGEHYMYFSFHFSLYFSEAFFEYIYRASSVLSFPEILRAS